MCQVKSQETYLKETQTLFARDKKFKRKILDIMKLYVVLLFLGLSVLTVCCADTLEIADTLNITSSHEQVKEVSLSEMTSYRYIPIQNSQEANQLSRILAQTPGVTTKKYGAVGSFQTVSIRGTEGKRVAVYLDGVPQMSSLGGAVDLSRFSGMNLSAVEIYRGFSPSKFGGNSLGGVINLISDSPHSEQHFSFTTGSFGEMEGRALLSLVKDSTNIKGGVVYHKADNNYPFWSRNGTPYNEADDFTDTMQNNEFLSLYSSLAATKKLTKNKSVIIKGSYEKIRREIPTYEGMDHNKTANWQEEGFSVFTRFIKQFPSASTLEETFTLSAAEGAVEWMGVDKFRYSWGNPKADEVARLESKSMKLQNSLCYNRFIGEKISSESRFDLIWETVLPKSNQVGYSIGDWESNDYRAKLSTDLKYFGDWGNCITGGTIEVNYAKNRGGETGHETLKIPEGTDTTLAWAVQGGVDMPLFENHLSLFANLGRFSRLPSIRERFGFHGNVLPNPIIEPEEGFNSEIGASFSKGKVKAETVLFYNKHKELIVIVYDGVVGRSDNVSSSRVFGLEQSLLLSPLSWLRLEENLTWQKSENLENPYEGNPLPDQPDFSIASKVHIGSFNGFTLTPMLDYSSTFYRDFAKSMAYPADTTKHGQFHLSSILQYKRDIICLELQFLDILDNKENKQNESGYYKLLYPGRSIQFTIGIKL